MKGCFHYISSRYSQILFFFFSPVCVKVPTVIILLFAFHFLFSSPGQVTQLKDAYKYKIHQLRTIGDNISISYSWILFRESLNPEETCW